MRRQMIFAAALILAAAALLTWGLVPGILGQGAHDMPVVALVLDTDIGLHAATIKQGAKLAARELKAKLIALAPTPGEDAAAAQIALIKRQIDQGVSALLLVPASESMVYEAEACASEANVRLVLLDAGERPMACYVGTDHRESGALAVSALVERTSGPVRLMVLTAPDEGLCVGRLQGAIEAIEGEERITLSSIEMCKDAEEAELLVRQTAAQGSEINALLCLSGALSEGAARALTAIARAQDVCLIGFDCDQSRVTYLQSGAVRATVLRSPLNIGYLGLSRALEEGPEIHTPSFVVDKANMLDPRYVKLVFPLVQ